MFHLALLGTAHLVLTAALLLAALLTLLASLPLLLTLLLALLSLLALLPLLALLALLPLLGLALLLLALLLTLLRLLSTRELFHLLAKFLSFATKHFLLPALLRGLLLIGLLLGEFLLAPGEFFQFRERVIHGFLLFLSRGLLAALVLVLLGVQFEIKKVLQIAAGSAAHRPRRRPVCRTQPESGGKWLRRAASIAAPSVRA